MGQAVYAKILTAQACGSGKAGAGASQLQGKRAGDTVQGKGAGDAARLAGADEMHGGVAAGGQHVWRQGLTLAVRVGHKQAGHLDRDIDVAGHRARAAEHGGAIEVLERTVDGQQAEAKDGVADLAVGRGDGQALRQRRGSQAQAGQDDGACGGAARGLCIGRLTA